SIEQQHQNDEGHHMPKDFADWRDIPSEALEQKELRRALVQALDSLPEKYRAVLILRDVQHLGITDTAQILGLSEANVKPRLCRARLQGRDCMFCKRGERLKVTLEVGGRSSLVSELSIAASVRTGGFERGIHGMNPDRLFSVVLDSHIDGRQHGVLTGYFDCVNLVD